MAQDQWNLSRMPVRDQLTADRDTQTNVSCAADTSSSPNLTHIPDLARHNPAQVDLVPLRARVAVAATTAASAPVPLGTACYRMCSIFSPIIRSRAPAQAAQAQVAARVAPLPQPRPQPLQQHLALQAAVAPVHEARPRRVVTRTIIWTCLEDGEMRSTSVTYDE